MAGGEGGREGGPAARHHTGPSSCLHAHAAGTELHTVKGMVGALMHELEVILHEYLSFNWDRLDDILAANKHLLEPEGPALPSPRPRDSAETAHSNDGQVCTLVGNVHHGLHPAS